jgi:GT2 family glycosyltransferase
VVLNWNNLPDTFECVASVRDSDYASLDIVVVDNASREDPTAAIRARHPEVGVLRTSANLGYGGGNNVGVTYAISNGADYVLLMNNDAILARDCLRRLVAALEAHPRIGMVTPRIFLYDRPSEVYWDGGTLDWITGDMPHDSRTLPVDDDMLRSEWLNGCTLLIRVAAIRDIGFMDERYFLYYEDVDWSLRAKSREWILAVLPHAEAWHKVSRSAGGMANPAVRFYYLRNRYFCVTTYGPLRGRLRWRLRYAKRLALEYVGVAHLPESRVAVTAVCVSLLLSRRGPYETTGIMRVLTLLLDRVLLVGLRAVLGAKRLLRRAGLLDREAPR